MSEHAQHHVVPIKTYVAILIALMALLVVTVWASFIDFDKIIHHGTGWSTGIAILIALIKAVLIVLIFMHVKYGSKTTWVFAAASFFWLGIMIVLMMLDYVSRGAPLGANPKGEPYYFPAQLDPQLTGVPAANPQTPILPDISGPVSDRQ